MRMKIIPHEGCRGFGFIHERYESYREGKFTAWVRGSFPALIYLVCVVTSEGKW